MSGLGYSCCMVVFVLLGMVGVVVVVEWVWLMIKVLDFYKNFKIDDVFFMLFVGWIVDILMLVVLFLFD